MVRSILIPIFLIAILELRVFAAEQGKKYLFFIGGEGEPPGDTTMFDTAATILASTSRAAGWTPEVAFDGGHSKSEELVTRAFGITPSQRIDFTKGYLASLAQQLIQRVNSRKLEKGDSVLLYVDSHGDPRTASERSHSVECHNGEQCSLDVLENAIRALESAGIKVALVDMSCFSGASLALSSPKTCVITGASGQTISFSSAAENLAGQLHSGNSLESAFLAVRDQDLGSMEISSPTGLEVRQMIDPLVEKVDIASTLVDERAPNPVCAPAETDINPLPPSVVDAISEAIRTKHRRDFKALDEALARYKVLFAQIENIEAFLNQNAWRAIQTPDGPITWTSAATVRPEDFLETAQEIERLKSKGDKDQLGWFQKKLKFVRRALSIREKLLTGNPEFRKFSELSRKFLEWVPGEHSEYLWKSPLVLAANEVRRAEKAVYRDLYTDIAHDNPGKPDPCEDFKF